MHKASAIIQYYWLGCWLVCLMLCTGGSWVSVHASQLPDFTELVSQNRAAVVNIRAAQQGKTASTLPPGFDPRDLNGPMGDFLRRFFNEPQNPADGSSRASGSGFLISADGYILTNQHVIEATDDVRVRLSDNNEFKAEIVGIDKPSDIALLKIAGQQLPHVKIGQSATLKVGAWVFAIGSPFGLEHSVTAGIVSAKGRSLSHERFVPFIQTDVAVNPGNSGGPLFNLQGEVVGINAMIYSQTGGYMGLSFAIPIELAMEVTAQLQQRGKVRRGWLGVVVQPVTPEQARRLNMKAPIGAWITEIEANSPATQAQLQTDDIILGFNHTPITEAQQLLPAVAMTAIGTPVTLELLRQGQVQEAHTVIQEQPEPAAMQPTTVTNSRLAITVTDVTPDQQKELGLTQAGGVSVSAVEETGPAYQAGIRPQDVILQLKNHPITSSTQFNEWVANLPAGQPIAVLVQRKSGPAFLALQLSN